MNSVTPYPRRLFLDTNVYIIGVAMPDSPEAAILRWVGFEGTEAPEVEVIASEALFLQIRRVAKRVEDKDWAGQIVMRIWNNLTVRFVLVDAAERARLAQTGSIPREDVDIFLAAREGEADCFVSANRELVRTAAAQTGAFECLTPEEFVAQYLSS